MLGELTIRDFALIEEMTLTFTPTLNIITGETGAGKSILIGALGALMGMRTGPDVVRTGAEKAVVEARFRLHEEHPAMALVRKLGGEAEEGEVIVQRELGADGRTRAWVGGVSVPVKTLRAVADRLVDFHGQHDHQLLLAPGEHGSILDAFAENADRLSLVRERAKNLRSLREEREALLGRQRELAAQRDMIEFERRELDEINPEPDEYERLDAERKVLENVEHLGNLLTGLVHLLSEAEDSVLTRLGSGRRWLQDAAEIDRSVAEEVMPQYEQMEVLVQEAANTLADRLASLDADPLRLEQVQTRLDQLRRLVRRYGAIEQAIARRHELQKVADTEAGMDEKIAAAEAQIVAEHECFSKAVAELSDARERAARNLGTAITKSLDSLGMARARFAVDLKRTPAEDANPVASDAVRLGQNVWNAGPDGAEQIEFMIAPNLGEPLKALARIASGGEVSRIMLAIKSVLAAHDPVATMVFDEIDLGVSGRIADAVGDRMRHLAQHRQIISITHLPQIAACADRHIVVNKRELKGRTVTEAHVLTPEERPRALAELLAGAEITETALDHARAMLNVRNTDDSKREDAGP